MDIYLVKTGDSVDSIAAAFSMPVAALIYDNQLVEPYALAVGQALLITENASTPAEDVIPVAVGEGRPLVVNGYAYPYISRWVLAQTLPFLSELSVFSYGFSAEGELEPPAQDADWMVEEAAAYGVRPVLTLTPIDESGSFNNYLITSVVQNPAYKARLIAMLREEAAAKGYAGVDVDFEYISAEDRDAFTAFVEDLAAAMHEDGRTVSVALAPKTSADQPGILYQGKDYPALGAAADSVLLMTYEWGYKYGPNMAVAPIDKVRRVVEYAVTEIPAEKISLGVPNYGYDWPLPFVKDVTAAVTIGNVEAVQIAIKNGAEILYDEEAQSPYFRYERDGVAHEVWFEDVRSILAKCELIEEFGLRGAGYWQIMRWWRANWLLLDEAFARA